MEQLGKDNLKVNGEKFVLAAQIALMKTQNSGLNTEYKNYEENAEKEHWKVDSEFKTL